MKIGLFVIVIICSVVTLSCQDNNMKDAQQYNEANKVNHDSSSQTQINNQGIRNYRKMMKQYKTSYKNGQLPDTSIIEKLIPTSIEEYSIFYESEYDSTNATLPEFIHLDTMIEHLAAKNVGNCLVLYLNMIEFVDGEYAESYMDGVDYFIEKYPRKFCLVYDKLSIQAKESLSDNFNKICK